MSKRIRTAAAGASAVALAVGVAACGSSSSSGPNATVTGSTLTVYSSLPDQGASSGQAHAMENGARLAIAKIGGKIGKFTVQYKPLDDSLASSGAADEGKGAQNARTAAGDKTAVGYMGEYNSGISKVTIPILNQAGIAQVSPSNTYVGLTTNAPGSQPGEPQKYYPTAKRTFARVVPIDTIQGAALAGEAKTAGCTSLHIWNSKTTYSVGLAANVTQAAQKLGLKVEGNDGIDPKAPNYRSLAANIHSDCFVYTGEIESNGTQAVKDAAASNPALKLFAGDGDCLNATADPTKGLPPAVASRFHCTIATLDPKAFPPSGRAFFAQYKAKYGVAQPDPYAIYGYESMALLLDSIQRAEASGKLTRMAVVKQLFSTKSRQSVLGMYSIDANGDTSLTDYGVYKIAGGKLVFDHVIHAGAAA